MKKLTLNHLAFSGLRANRKEYRLLCVGVFLAVFFTVGTLLGLDILFQRSEAETAANMAGRMHFISPLRQRRRN